MHDLSRRSFLSAAAAAVAADLDFPLVDFHVHLDAVVTLEKALEISRRLGVKFGIVEHAGKTVHKYVNLLSTDEQLTRYAAGLKPHPVFIGIQAEGIDWMECFSKAALRQLDYALTDALTLPEKNGELVRIWTPRVRIDDKQEFMDRYVDFHVEILEKEPIQILANVTFLPAAIQAEYDTLWTPARMRRIVDAALKHRVALEINSNYKLPKLPMLRMARQAGVKFSFGSNIHGLGVGNLDYCVEMAHQLRLTRKDMFSPKRG